MGVMRATASGLVVLALRWPRRTLPDPPDLVEPPLAESDQEAGLMVLPHGNPFLHKQLQTGPPLEPVTTTAPEPPVPSSCPDTGLSEGQVMELALALHERWHGTHIETSDAYTLACADRAGAFTDAELLAPVLAGWIRDAFTKAARDVERWHRIATTPRADVDIEDLAWFADQDHIRSVVSDHNFLTRKRAASLADWLHSLADGIPA